VGVKGTRQKSRLALAAWSVEIQNDRSLKGNGQPTNRGWAKPYQKELDLCSVQQSSNPNITVAKAKYE